MSDDKNPFQNHQKASDIDWDLKRIFVQGD